MLVRRKRDDNGPVYTIEFAFFYWIDRGLAWKITMWVIRGSLLDRWLGTHVLD